jgi:hypothetical protein
MLALYYLLIEGAITIVTLGLVVYILHLIFDSKWTKEK